MSRGSSREWIARPRCPRAAQRYRRHRDMDLSIGMYSNAQQVLCLARCIADSWPSTRLLHVLHCLPPCSSLFVHRAQSLISTHFAARGVPEQEKQIEGCSCRGPAGHNRRSFAPPGCEPNWMGISCRSGRECARVSGKSRCIGLLRSLLRSIASSEAWECWGSGVAVSSARRRSPAKSRAGLLAG
jgi:hypothetical protein